MSNSSIPTTMCPFMPDHGLLLRESPATESTDVVLPVAVCTSVYYEARLLSKLLATLLALETLDWVVHVSMLLRGGGGEMVRFRGK